MLLAVVDLGSNSFKMTVAQWVPELKSRRPFRILHKERYPVQLGLSVFSDGRMSPKARKAAFAALQKMQIRLRDFGAPILRVVGTSALREAADAKSFVDEVREKIGLSIEIIAGAEEARLIAQGLEWEYPKVGRGLLVDIGGGSSEVASFGAKWNPDFLHSFRLGSVRVAAKFFEGRRTPDIPGARRWVRTTLAKLKRPTNVERLIGSAGTLQSLGEILGGGRAVPVIRRDRLDAWITAYADAKPAQLEKTWRLTKSRARVLVPGAIVLSEILAWLGSESIAVTSMTLRDGLMVDLVTKWRAEGKVLREASVERFHQPLQKGYGEKLLGYLDRTAQAFGLDRAKAAHTALLASRFFEGLKGLGVRLKEDERLYLFVVAYLHGCGRLISTPGYHRHSAYILRHLDVPGLAERERDLLSLAAFYQRKDEPPRRDPLPLGLRGEEARKVRRVASILRVLVALEASKAGVGDLRLRRVKKQLILELFCAGSSTSTGIDPKKLREALGAFEKAFELRLVPHLRVDSRAESRDATK